MKSNSFIYKSFLILCSLITSSILTSAQTTIVKGKLLDVDGKPSRFALVGTIEMLGARIKNFVSTDNEGNYKINLSKPGVNYILFNIPGHSAIPTAILSDKDKEITINVRLSPYKYKDKIDEVGVAGSFNGFNISSPEMMIKREDGTYEYEINTDLEEIKYQLCKIEANNRTINAPESVSFEPDSTGDYYSVMKVEKGIAKIIFDPAKLLRSDKTPEIEFFGADLEKALYEYSKSGANIKTDANKKLMEYIEAKKDYQAFQYDFMEYLPELLKKIEEEKNEDVKNFMKLDYISFITYNPKNFDFNKATEFYDSVPPESFIWDFLPQAFFSYNRLLPQYKWNQIQDNFLGRSKNKTIRLSIYQNKLSTAKFRNNADELQKLHDMIIKDYPDLKEAQDILKKYPVDSKIKIGEEIPDFEVTSIDNNNVKFSKTSMLGKVYLIDFWATWCGPCVSEMETLHKAYAKFKDKGFEILSLSLDQNSEEVIKFRKDQWKMPWLNSFIGDLEGRKVADKFEVIGIPKPLLISAEGKILETEMNLRGSQLEATLKKYFQ